MKKLVAIVLALSGCAQLSQTDRASESSRYEVVAEKIVAMCLPDFQETGKLYDCTLGRFLTIQPPA